MARVCNRHPFLVSENLCGRCGVDYCRDCLVFPRGQKLPLCTKCAIAASGVRGSNGSAMPKRQLRSRVKERNRELTQPTVEPLPDIANPLPKGFAFDDEDMDFFSAAQADADAMTNRSADADGPAEEADGHVAGDSDHKALSPQRSRRLPRPTRSPKPARVEEPPEDNGAEMMDFLNSVYGPD